MNANENCAYKLPLQAINYIILSYINFVEYHTCRDMFQEIECD